MICEDLKEFKNAKATKAVKDILKYVKKIELVKIGVGSNICVDLSIHTENQDSGMTYETGNSFLFYKLKKDDAKFIKHEYKKLTKDEKKALIYSVFLKKYNKDMEKRNDWIYACEGDLKMEIV